MVSQSGSRVLVADSAERVRTDLYKALIDRGVFCDCAVSAGDAIARMRENTYAVMVLDLALPHAGAAAVIEELRITPEGQRPIVLATTPHADVTRDSETELVQIVLRKPLRIGDIADMIQSCVESLAVRN